MINFDNLPALALNEADIARANNASMFEAGSAIAHEAEKTYRGGLAAMAGYVKEPNERQQTILNARAESWRDLCEKSFNEELSRRASWVPWTVSGPANYPARKMNARADKAMQVASEWSAKRASFLENTRNMLRDAIPFEDILAEYRSGKRRDAISSDDAHAVEKLAARLEGMKERHEQKKTINAYWRKHKTAIGCPGISEKTAASIDEQMKPENNQFGKGLPFPTWSLSNGLAEIKRVEQRLQELQRMKERAEDVPEKELVYKGFRVVISSQDCRIYVYFDKKPDAPARDVLKANGFHWSPREGSWGRKLTDNAARAVKNYIVPGLLALDEYESYPAEETASALTLEEFAAMYATDAPEAAETVDECETFVNSILLSSTADRSPMTDNDAFLALTNWINEGVEVPKTLTAAKLRTLWNAAVS